MNNKTNSFSRIFQGAAFAFQAYQVLRYGSLMLVAVAFAWFLAPQQLIDDYETLLLIGGSTTFFWVGGLLDGFLLLHKKSDRLQADAALKQTMMLFLTFAMGSAVVSSFVGFWFYPRLAPVLVLCFASCLFFETVAQFLPYFFIAQNHPRRLLTYGVVSSLGYCLAIGVPLVMGEKLEVMVTGLLLASILKFGWLLAETKRIDGQGARQSGINKALWQISLPLILATLLSQSAVFVDGFLVQRFFPQAFVDFRYGAKEFPLVLLLANSMSVVRAGEIAHSLRTGEMEEALRGLRSSSSRLIWILFPISIGFMLASGPLFKFFFVDRFPLAVPVFDLFLLLTIPRLMFPQAVIRGMQKTKMMSVSAGVELLLNVGLSLLLMGPFGIAGIAAGTVIAFIGEKFILLGYAQFKLGISWNRYAAVPLWIGASTLLLLVWLCKYVVCLHLGV